MKGVMKFMVDAHICKTPNELAQTEGEMDSGIGIDDIPKDITDRKLGSPSKKSTFGKVNVKPLDDEIRKALKPNKKNDPFNRDNWSF